MSTRPTLVIVPGSFAGVDLYDPLVNPLRKNGYTVHVLQPPCYPAHYGKGTSPGLYDDAKFVNDFLGRLADEGKEIVVLAHSYGGVPASEGLKGVTQNERSAQGKKGGVVRVAYLTCIVPRIGGSVMSMNSTGGMPPIGVDENGWMTQLEPAETARLCFNDLSSSEGTKEAAKFGKHASKCFTEPLTHAGYAHVPVSWFLCEKDLCIAPSVQQAGIDAIEESWKGTKREGRKVEVKRVECDHIALLSVRDEVEEWVEEVVGKGGRE